ncbi:hypothetical protein ILUMI_11705 [Ignelater luminosus]|uniref:PiggyBac transposable element-derived protein domain-containing protein n=1 Tax=Ignelater luminosus TaxID=2038154 RepID=A0A8K0CXX6_IGNLU|nr:hypothetical protein ILUMI_11705 [Ignelater luminosus]
MWEEGVSTAEIVETVDLSVSRRPSTVLLTGITGPACSGTSRSMSAGANPVNASKLPNSKPPGRCNGSLTMSRAEEDSDCEEAGREFEPAPAPPGNPSHSSPRAGMAADPTNASRLRRGTRRCWPRARRPIPDRAEVDLVSPKHRAHPESSKPEEEDTRMDITDVNLTAEDWEMDFELFLQEQEKSSTDTRPSNSREIADRNNDIPAFPTDSKPSSSRETTTGKDDKSASPTCTRPDNPANPATSLIHGQPEACPFKKSTIALMRPWCLTLAGKQFMRGKPIRWGYKLWTGTTRLGYILWFDPYQGASSVIPDQYKDLGSKASVVLRYADILQSTNMTLQNAWHLQRINGGKLDQVTFRRRIAMGILESYKTTTKCGPSKNLNAIHNYSRFDRLDHLVIYQDVYCPTVPFTERAGVEEQLSKQKLKKQWIILQKHQ